MIPDKVIYTDGRDVVVTDSTFTVKNASYRLNGITKLAFWTIRPDRWPAVLLTLIGLISAVCGYMTLLPHAWIYEMNDQLISANAIALWAGVALFVLGILIMAMTREKYAVRIATAEGEKNAIVSSKRDYISQIVDAIHSAFDMGGHDHPTIVVTKK